MGWRGRRVRRGLLVSLLAVCTLPGCATRPSGVLIPETVAVGSGSTVDMLVATTRSPSPEPGVLFSGERGDLAFTEIAVSIPPDSRRKAGEIQWPDHMPANPATDFTTVTVKPVSIPQGVRDWAKQSLSQDRHVLVFVHGFNTQYDEAVYRLAQIVHDSGARVTPVLFTWPSRGSALQYPYDKESTNYSRTALEDMLWRIAQDPSVGRVSILAHSMGTWLTVEALRQLAIRHGTVPSKIDTVMLASADLDVDVFRQQMRDLGSSRPRTVLFVSHDDKALGLSRALAGDVDRVGQVDPAAEPYRSILEKVQGVTVVDLSALDTGDQLNHSKFAESPAVVQLIGRRLAGQSIEPGTDVGTAVGGSIATALRSPIDIITSGVH